MCGRFTLTYPADALARLFGAAADNDLPQGPRFNICPTQPVLAVTSDAGVRRLRAMRWGFVPAWYKTPTDGPLIVNARSDTVAVKPAFRQAIRERRCLIPATGFYEWTEGPGGARLPWYITPADGSVLAFAGVWQDWGPAGARLTTCAIVSTEAGPEMARLHHREPLTLPPEDWPLWLGEAGHGAARLMRPRGPGVYAMHRVDPAVNSNRVEGPQLIEPLPA
ncbi:MAG: SOS response-associated peptidase [Rhodobacterales bacterium]|nr:SOS response-associated peptidase [Rhodobacterales bacterium]